MVSGFMAIGVRGSDGPAVRRFDALPAVALLLTLQSFSDGAAKAGFKRSNC